MNTKKFAGFIIIGAQSKQEAKIEKGLVLWLPKKPNSWVRFWNRLLLGIYWVDKEQTLVIKPSNPIITEKNGEFIATEILRVKPYRKPLENGERFKNTNTK